RRWDKMLAMKKKPNSTNADAAIWQRVVHLEGDLPPTAARALLRLRFSEEDREQMHRLGAKARAGTLNARGQAQIDLFERLGCLLDIVHSKARQALKKRKVS